MYYISHQRQRLHLRALGTNSHSEGRVSSIQGETLQQFWWGPVRGQSYDKTLIKCFPVRVSHVLIKIWALITSDSSQWLPSHNFLNEVSLPCQFRAGKQR